MVDEITISPVSRNLSDVFLRQQEHPAGSASTNQQLFLISDFQKSTSDLIKYPPGHNCQVSSLFRSMPINRNNLYIDSVWFESPVQQPLQQSRLRVRLKNYGTDPIEKIPVKLTLNGIQKAVTSAALPAKASV